ncbi:MAG: hypothetical protein ACC656_11150, partial [Candidatus Heimdallarchaeota archaeon]
MKFCTTCGRKLDENSVCSDCNKTYKPVDSQQQHMEYKPKPWREYSTGVKISYLAIFALIVLDLYLSYTVIKEDSGYGGLVAIGVQAMFIPAIVLLALLHLRFKNREDENDRRKIQNLPTIPSFNDKFKLLSS